MKERVLQGLGGKGSVGLKTDVTNTRRNGIMSPEFAGILHSWSGLYTGGPLSSVIGHDAD